MTRRMIPSFFCLLLLVASGCGNSSLERPADTLILRINQNPTTLDPAYSTDVISGKLIGMLFGNLVRYDAEGHVVADLAESWKVAKDGLSYRFRLRKGATFSNGQAITSQDVLFSFTRCLDPKTASTRAWVFEPIEGARAFREGKAEKVSGLEAIDERELTIRLHKAFAPFLGFLAMPAGAIVPRQVLEQRGKDFAHAPIGSGPYELVEWLRDKHLILKANERCPTGAPKLAKIRLRILTEPITASVEFKSGRLDAMIMPFAEQAFFRAHPVWSKQILVQPGQNVYFLGLNCTRPPFDRVEVRQAIAHAIDARAIVETVRAGQSVVAHGPIPPGISGFDPSFQGLPFDPAQSKSLLKACGLEGKVEVEILQGSNKQNLEVTRLLESFLIRAGFKVRLSSLEWGVFTERLKKGDFDAFYRSWWADYPDGENFLYPLFHSSRKGAGGNWPLYSNPELDRSIEEAQATVDDELRWKRYRNIAARATEEASRVFLFHKTEPIVVQPWVRGLKIHPVFNANKYDGVFLDEARLRKGI